LRVLPMATCVLSLVLLLFLSVLRGSLADHACDAEVEAACPDRPGSELAACLKDQSQHDRPTELSSECTDFIALNAACATDIEKFCDDAYFSRDTTLCLSEWTNQADLTPKCVGVMKWAIPKKADEDETGPTDELGLSEKDYAEKKAWQANRKKARGAAIERMRETDAAKEKERLKMERIKKENPEEYEWLMKEQEDAKKRKDEAMKRERLMAAALERKKREESGDPEEPVEEETRSRRRNLPTKPTKDTWLPWVLGGLFVAFIFFNILNFFTKDKDD